MFEFISKGPDASTPSRKFSPRRRLDRKFGRSSHSHFWKHVTTGFKHKLNEVRLALHDTQHSPKSEDSLISLLRELKAYSDSLLRTFTTTSLSVPDYRIFQPSHVPIPNPVSKFEPTLARTIFSTSNASSTRSLGLQGTISQPSDTAEDTLRSLLLQDPIARGQDYLQRNAGNHYSETTARIEPDDPLELWENFSQLLILEATNDRTLVKIVDHSRMWNFFQGKKFPYDIDTTSIGLVCLERDTGVVHSVIDEMLEYVNPEGIILTYFDHTRRRVDPVVCINALTLFYTYGRGHLLPNTLAWVHSLLLERAYIGGTRYYTTAECFLYFLSRLLSCSADESLHALIMPLLKERIRERIGQPGDALALAMRILVCDFVGVKNVADLGALLSLQCEDGSWEIGWIYQLPSVGILVGNRGLTTALAVKAVAAVGSWSVCE